MAYLDNNGVTYLWNKIKALFNKGITNLSVNGRTITYTKGDGTTNTITTQDTYSDMKGATTTAAGTHGLAPAPAAGAANRYLRSDGTWSVPPDNNTTYNDATQSAHGLMTAADKKKLDGIATNANNYTHPTTSGNKHIPAGGSSGQILRWSADGTAVWGADKDTTYSDFKAAASGDMMGTHGLVPAPAAGQETMVLFASGYWGSLQIRDYNPSADKRGFWITRDEGEAAVDLCGFTFSGATSSVAGLMSATDKDKLDALPTNATLSSTYAKKSEITNMYKYCGSVASSDKLPTTGQRVGDVYNIEAASKYGGAGMNVAWNGSAWDPLGEIFTITAITNAEIDAICV